MPETKSAFVRRVHTSRQAVQAWVRDRKIDGAALVRRGHRTLIDPDVAIAQLEVRLDGGQRLGNGLGTKLRRPSKGTPAKSAPAATPSPAAAQGPADDIDPNQLDETLKREKVAQLQRLNRKGAEDEAARQGRYTNAEAARREMTRVAAHVLQAFESAIPEIATAVDGPLRGARTGSRPCP